MEVPALSRRLSATDAAFFYLERTKIPLHIASVSIFDGPIPYKEFVANIDSKLHLLPRYTEIAVAPPYNVGYPVWEPDPHFDIRRHILRARVAPPGGEAELEELAGKILGQVMDRRRPLWDIHVIEGLQDGRGALIARVHHSLADGIAGEALMSIMLDPTPEGSCVVRKKRPRQVEQQKAPEVSLTDALISGVHSTLQNLISAEGRLLDLAADITTGRMLNPLMGLATLLPEFATSVERLPFNQPCGSERKFCWAEFDFQDVRAIKAAVGGTVNDIILTVLMRAVARYCEMHGESTAKRFVKVVCPMNVRREEDQGESLGNRISFMPVALPIGIKDPVRMLHEIAHRTAIMKSARACDLLAVMTTWLGVAPPPLQALLWSVIPDIPMPVPLLNMICTNVMGSPTPLYAVGRKMIASYPHVPTGYELGVNCAAQTYAGKLFFGFTADAGAAPDVGSLRDFLRVSFDELCRAAGIKKPVRRAARAKAKPPVRRKKTVKTAPPPAAEPAVAAEAATAAKAEAAAAPRAAAAASGR